MHSTDLKILLLRAGVSGSDIARRAGVQPQAVSQVLKGHRRTPFIRRAIAEALSISYRSCWGEEDPGIDRLPAFGRAVSTVTPIRPVRAGRVARGA